MKHFFDRKILDESKTRQNDNQSVLPGEKKKKGFFERSNSEPEKKEKGLQQYDQRNDQLLSPAKSAKTFFEKKTNGNENVENKSDKSLVHSTSIEKKSKNFLEGKTSGESSNPEYKSDKNSQPDKYTVGEKKRRFFFERRMTASRIDDAHHLESNRGADRNQFSNMKETGSDSVLTGRSSVAVKLKKKALRMDREDEKTKEEGAQPPVSMKDVKNKGSSALDIIRSIQRSHSASFYLAKLRKRSISMNQAYDNNEDASLVRKNSVPSLSKSDDEKEIDKPKQRVKVTKDPDPKETKSETSSKQNEGLLKKIKEVTKEPDPKETKSDTSSKQNEGLLKKIKEVTKDSDSKENKSESSSKQNEALLKKIKERIKKDKTASQIILVNEDDYWTETVSTNTDIHKSNLLFLCSLLNIDQSAMVYGKDFAANEHHNYAVEDIYGQKMILSVMLDPSESNSVYRTIIRTSDKTLPSKIETWQADQPMSLEQIAKHTFPGTRIAHYSEITADDAVDALKTFDEQTISNTFKFGVFYQKSGQITEEEMFNNRQHSTFMQDFLDFIATRVKLADFKGFSGGLDTQHDLTGKDSYYEVFEGNEIMFHVSTLLPFNENDPQQIERKRHIGNDIVAVVFQDPGAKFCPEVISSQFLQVFLCVQPSLTERKEITYKMAVVAKAEVSHFGPFLDGLGVYSKNEVLKKCFYSKLINAQISACTSAGKIGSMLERRRQMLFKELYTKLAATEKDDEAPKVTGQNPHVPNGEVIVRFIKNRTDSTDSESEVVFERYPNVVQNKGAASYDNCSVDSKYF